MDQGVPGSSRNQSTARTTPQDARCWDRPDVYSQASLMLPPMALKSATKKDVSKNFIELSWKTIDVFHKFDTQKSSKDFFLHFKQHNAVLLVNIVQVSEYHCKCEINRLKVELTVWELSTSWTRSLGTYLMATYRPKNNDNELTDCFCVEELWVWKL